MSPLESNCYTPRTLICGQSANIRTFAGYSLMVISTAKVLSDVHYSFKKLHQNQLTASDCYTLAANTLYNASVFTFACAVTPLIGDFTCYLSSDECGSNSRIFGNLEDRGAQVCNFSGGNQFLTSEAVRE